MKMKNESLLMKKNHCILLNLYTENNILIDKFL